MAESSRRLVRIESPSDCAPRGLGRTIAVLRRVDDRLLDLGFSLAVVQVGDVGLGGCRLNSGDYFVN